MQVVNIKCVGAFTLEKTSFVARLRFEMHPRAFFVLVLVLALGRGIRCEDKTGWYSGLRTVFKNCPSESWNASAQDEFLEMFRRCLQTRALTALDTFLEDDVIPVFDGLDLVRFQEDRINSSASERNGKLEESDNWTTIILNRLIRILRTHVFKVDVDYLTSAIKSQLNGFGTDLNNNVVEGRRRRHKRRHHHMMPLMMMGLLLMGSILVPMGFQFLAVLGGKALILAKMALILSSIQGLKKIATNGVNYGLYHTPVAEGWHERSNQETPPHFDLPYPTYPRSHL
ncbi:hypothetical protein KM043_017536 [Ampulex compressa]|nr:hypothetical protein KM043_017536 [Ampulex compressa]